MKKAFFPLILTAILLLGACFKDKAVNPCAEVVEIGRFGLLEASKDFLPYENVNKVFFRSENGDTLSMETTHFQNNYIPTAKELDCAEDESFSAWYEYTAESKFITLANNTVPLTIEIRLNATPYFPEIEAVKIADILTVAIQSPNREFVYYQMMSFYTAQREHPHPTISGEQYLGAVELNGQPFDSVYYEEKFFNVDGVDTNFETYYNKQFGLIGFKDYQEVSWVFDYFE